MESIRRIVMFNWMTANGYFAGADGDLDWVVPDQEQAKAAAHAIPLCDTVLFGRCTYELFERFWSHAGDDGSTAPDPIIPENELGNTPPSRSG
jgi:dihydrofolate reductase